MDDAYVVVCSGDGMEELSYVERAALWAAIEDLMQEAWMHGELDRARARVRELLGMEAES